jgi:hypothetical protein
VKPREDEPEKPLRNFTAGCHRASGGTGGGAIPTGPAQRSFTSKTNPPGGRRARTLTVTAAGDRAVTAPRSRCRGAGNEAWRIESSWSPWFAFVSLAGQGQSTAAAHFSCQQPPTRQLLDTWTSRRMLMFEVLLPSWTLCTCVVDLGDSYAGIVIR